MRRGGLGVRASISLRLFVVSMLAVMAGSGALAGPTMAAARNPSALGLLLGALSAFPALTVAPVP